MNGGEPEALEAGEVPSWQLALHRSINQSTTRQEPCIEIKKKKKKLQLIQTHTANIPHARQLISIREARRGSAEKKALFLGRLLRHVVS